MRLIAISLASQGASHDCRCGRERRRHSGHDQHRKQQTGKPIQFWGRYFKDAGNSSPEQYQPEDEAPLFKSTNIRVLPIGRQTNHVSGTQAVGKTDGKTNGEAIVDAFGAQVLGALPAGLLVFLDIEGPPHPSLSTAYYKGWSAALVQAGTAAGVTLLPGVYGAEGDSATWTHLVQAIGQGAPCAGTWIARPGTMGCHAFPTAFNEPHVRPPQLPASVKVLIWQCVQERQDLDFNLMNPNFEADTLSKLVLPG